MATSDEGLENVTATAASSEPRFSFTGLSPSFDLQPALPAPHVQQSPDMLRQLIELGLSLFDKTSLAAYQLGGRMLGSPDATVRALGAAVCFGALAYAADKLEKKLSD